MTMQTWPKTVFDTPEWRDAWSRATIETVTAADPAEPGLYAVAWSPFWGGYEADAGVGPVWDRPVLTIGSLYQFYGPSYLLGDPGAVDDLMDRAAGLAEEWDTAGVLVANLPEGAARAWAAAHPPDAAVRLDVAYHRSVGVGADPIVGDVSSKIRGDWRRRRRRAQEQGLRLVEEREPDGHRVDELLAMANESATRHDWPVVYDRATADEVLATPGARLFRADIDGETVAGFITLEHNRRLYLWAGGTHPTLLREVSPYLFVLYELLAAAADRGWERVEFGRGNDAFKRRYGFDGTDLWSLWYAPATGAEPYRDRLAVLGERLSDVMGLPPAALTHHRQPAPVGIGA